MSILPLLNEKKKNIIMGKRVAKKNIRREIIYSIAALF
jgi:hypothetical protein